MTRLVALAQVLAALLIGTASLQSAAQDKKDPPKKKERIAVAEPKDVEKDPDFAVQGEYVGEVTMENAKGKVGAQVIAKGQGDFGVKFLTGGLPGDGWDGKTATTIPTARSQIGEITFKGKDYVGSIAKGVIKLQDGSTLNKVSRQSKTLGAKPPEGAVVLFGSPEDTKNWEGGKIVELSDGKFLNMGIKSKEKFGAFKAHVEFRLPWMPNSAGQARANSGVYLQDRYEVQVLDSFGLKGENNECGGIYTQYKPLVNMCYPPMTWQTYDIEFTPAQFGTDGKKTAGARTTIYHNGVMIQDNVELKGPTGGGQPETMAPGPIQLQNHGDPLVYQNIWVLPVK